MAIDSVNSGSYTNLQSVLEAARKRTASVDTKPAEVAKDIEPVRLPKSSGGTLLERLYGAKVETKQAEPARVGTRFDRYA